MPDVTADQVLGSSQSPKEYLLVVRFMLNNASLQGGGGLAVVAVDTVNVTNSNFTSNSGLQGGAISLVRQADFCRVRIRLMITIGASSAFGLAERVLYMSCMLTQTEATTFHGSLRRPIG
jgi:hypothetical protein